MRKSLDFYIKWSASFASLALVTFNSYDFTPYDRIMGLLTAILWMWYGVVKHESALWIPNVVFAIIYFSGFLK